MPENKNIILFSTPRHESFFYQHFQDNFKARFKTECRVCEWEKSKRINKYQFINKEFEK